MRAREARDRQRRQGNEEEAAAAFKADTERRTSLSQGPLRTPSDIMRDPEAKQRQRLQFEQEDAIAAAATQSQGREQDEDMQRRSERQSAGVGAQFQGSDYSRQPTTAPESGECKLYRCPDG